MKTKAKNVILYLSLHYIPGDQVSYFLLEKAHSYPILPFIPDLSIEAFLVVLNMNIVLRDLDGFLKMFFQFSPASKGCSEICSSDKVWIMYLVCFGFLFLIA